LKNTLLKTYFGHIILLLILGFVLLLSCSDEAIFWPQNGTIVEAAKYRIELRDSSKILIESGKNYTLWTPPDSLLINESEISYLNIDSDIDNHFKGSANQKVKNSANSNITEYYSFEMGNVLLLGYTTENIEQPTVLFEPPLVISTSEMEGSFKSSGIMKNFNKEESKFEDEVKTNLKINEIKQVHLKNSKNENLCYLREMILTQDGTVGFGENNLIIPEAIIIKTKLLVDQNGYLIAEWGIKAKQNEELIKNFEGPEQKPSNDLYIEFTRYTIKTD
jgi:hypothetical protein